ncbi:MAG: sulfatase-like hydrolase/transferase [Bacteroidota bacterium]|nr:sulfatase-like hydrolase/transferase [Bacteroidota bacterium]
MNNFFPLLILFASTFCAANTSPVITTQEIHFRAENASEAFIVWGMNGWTQADSSLHPEGSFMKDGLLCSPMILSQNEFQVLLKVPRNSTLDFVFWISKGPRGQSVDLWDTNQQPFKDYHLLAEQNNVLTITSALSVLPKAPLSITDFGFPVLIFSSLLFLTFYFLRKRKLTSSVTVYRSNRIIVISAFLLFLGLLLTRPSVSGSSWIFYLHPFDNAGKIFTEAYYDSILVFMLLSLFLILSFLFRNYNKIQMGIAISCSVLCLLVFSIGILNIRVVELLGKPFTYQWLYYSDFLKSADAKAAVSANVSSDYLLNFVCILLSFFFLGMLLIGISGIIRIRPVHKKVILSFCSILIFGYLFYSGTTIRSQNVDYSKLANPVVEFAASVNPFSFGPSLFTMEVEDSLKFQLNTSSRKEPGHPAAGIKNVIFFVLESTPAEYISAYGSKYNVTPELDAYLSSSVKFNNVYAHAPATNNSMVSILASVYPWISYSTITQEHPGINLPTISSELKHRGYRTGFFNSADNRFQKADEFLSVRKFDKINDCRAHSCEAPGFIIKDENWEFLNGKDDECTQNEMVDWIFMDPAKPFFAMMWTYQTHYPYFVSGTSVLYEGSDSTLNKYLNAVHHSDLVFGKMMKSLKEKGILDSTLVVVVGDHGEAFGRHDQITHASKIYEENLHVPCMFIHPSFKGETSSSIGGLIDISPTVLDLLGIDPPKEWQGKSLFNRTENDRVYFFAPWSDYLFGYREKNYKYIYNATRNETEIYDLNTDPMEERKINVSSEQERICHQRMASWAQYVNGSMDKLFSSQAKH